MPARQSELVKLRNEPNDPFIFSEYLEQVLEALLDLTDIHLPRKQIVVAGNENGPT